MKTGLFIIIVLVSGCFAGLIHGGINLAIVEPYLDQAIGIENQTLFATGEEEDTPEFWVEYNSCLLYTSPSPRDRTRSRMPSSA